MAGFTNTGKTMVMSVAVGETETVPTYSVMLIKASPVPDEDTITVGGDSLVEIEDGNGYIEGGIEITDEWETAVLDNDAGNSGSVSLADLIWTASGGAIPSSSTGARYALLTDSNETINSRNVYAYWDLVSAREVSSGQTLTLQDLTLSLTEA